MNLYLQIRALHVTEVVESLKRHFYCNRYLIYSTMMPNLGSSVFQVASDFLYLSYNDAITGLIYFGKVFTYKLKHLLCNIFKRWATDVTSSYQDLSGTLLFSGVPYFFSIELVSNNFNKQIFLN